MRPQFLALCAWVVASGGLRAEVCDSPLGPDLDSFETIVVRSYPTRSYPSLRPEVYVAVVIDKVQMGFQKDWWKNNQNWVVLVDGKPFTSYETFFDNRESQAFFQLLGVRTGSKVKIRAILPPETGITPKKCAVSVEGTKTPAVETEITLNLSSLRTATLQPTWAPAEKLIDGTKRDVGQLAITLDFKSLARSGPVRVFLSGDELLSSDRKDAMAKLEGRFGVERSLLNSWYVPWRSQGELLSNQRGDNISFIASTGLRTIFPWRWSTPMLNNGAVKAPVSPEIEFDVQDENRLKQSADSLKKFKDPNTLRYYGEFDWTPIHLFPGAGFTKDDVSMEFTGKGWFLPAQTNSAGKKIDRLEGLAEVSILIPVRKFVPNGGIAPDPSADAAKQRIRLKYSIGANEANGFQHFKQWTLGYELIK